MKRILCSVLALCMIFSLCACSSQKLEGVEAPVDVLNAVWSGYAEEDKFFAMGGDYENIVDNAPGTVDVSNPETLYNLLACPEEAAAMIDGAASLIHAMNANTFTGAAYHIADGNKAEDFIAAMNESLKNYQWMCGVPEQQLIARLSDDYVVVAYGAIDLVSAFNVYLCGAFPSTETEVLEIGAA